MDAFRFCSECHNLLYPKEDRTARRLVFACRHCGHEEEAHTPCIYQHVVSVQARERKIAGGDLANDPTFPRKEKHCPQCGYHEAIYYQSRSKSRDATMKLIYACCNSQCGHRWSDRSVQ